MTLAPRFRRALLVAAAFASAVALAACGRAPERFGATPETGRAHAAEMFGGLSARFHNTRRVGDLEAIHRRLTRDALHPSSLFRDSTLWMTARGPTRVSLVRGTATDEGWYELSVHPAAPPPSRAGDVRIHTSLTRLSKNEYQWDTATDFALGRFTAANFVGGLRGALAELEQGDDQSIRSRIERTLPRSMRAFGAAFTLDTLRTSRREDGATLVHLGITLDPARLRGDLPAFGKYLEEYVTPARYRFTLVDEAGGVFGEASADDNLVTLRLAIRDGALVPLEEPARPLPDTLILRTEMFLHVLLFDVGMSELEGQMVLSDAPGTAGLSIRWREEPDWHFPLGTRHLIRTPLRRPFAGSGAAMQVVIRDPAHAGEPAILTRRVHLVVQESAILRFLSRLGGRAADDFDERVDEEANRFVSRLFQALAEDVAEERP